MEIIEIESEKPQEIELSFQEAEAAFHEVEPEDSIDKDIKEIAELTEVKIPQIIPVKQSLIEEYQ